MTCIKRVTHLHNGKLINRACGQCTRCLILKKLQWSGRLLAEGTQYESTSFLTLTYDESPVDLHYRDIQLFLKRLRKTKPIRFYCVGEYGERNGRPHWHLMLYGHHPPIYGLTQIKEWPHGLVFYGNLAPSSAAYVAGYNLKGIGDPRKAIARMSRKPGIGFEYFRRAGEICAKQGRSGDITHITYKDRKFPVDAFSRKVFLDSFVKYGGTPPKPFDPSGIVRSALYSAQMQSGSLDQEIEELRRDIDTRLRDNGY